MQQRSHRRGQEQCAAVPARRPPECLAGPIARCWSWKGEWSAALWLARGQAHPA